MRGLTTVLTPKGSIGSAPCPGAQGADPILPFRDVRGVKRSTYCWLSGQIACGKKPIGGGQSP